MKNLSFFVSAFALCTSTSYAAINCSTLPTCESLGYTDKVAECPKVYSWNATSKKLVATTTPKAVICPFDTAKGRCLHDAKIGDLKYSLHTVDHEGWILCDGRSLSTTTYSALYDIIGSNYGMVGTNFRVPDYRGFFLRAAGEAVKNTSATKNNILTSFGGSPNSDLTTPQKEQLPNITGQISSDMGKEAFTATFDNGGKKTLTSSITGAFYSSERFNGAYATGGDGIGYMIEFSAKESNSIYQNNGHVIPANYAANIFIYAGR